MRFAIRVDPWLRPLLLLFGVTPGRAQVVVEDDALHVRLGFFAHRFPRAHVVAADHVRRNWLYRLGAGIGWHTNFVDWLTVNGSLGGLVELQLAPAERFRLLGLPARCNRLWLSLDEPDAFLRALGPTASHRAA